MMIIIVKLLELKWSFQQQTDKKDKRCWGKRGKTKKRDSMLKVDSGANGAKCIVKIESERGHR